MVPLNHLDKSSQASLIFLGWGNSRIQATTKSNAVVPPSPVF